LNDARRKLDHGVNSGTLCFIDHFMAHKWFSSASV